MPLLGMQALEMIDVNKNNAGKEILGIELLNI